MERRACRGKLAKRDAINKIGAISFGVIARQKPGL